MADVQREINILVKPTVDLESAVACVVMLNLFLDSDERYVVIQHADGKLEIVEVERL